MNLKTETRQILWAGVGGLGGLAVCGGVLALLLGLLFFGPGMEIFSSLLWSIGLIALLLGVALLWSGWTGWQQLPSPSVHSWPALLGLAGFSLMAFLVGWQLPPTAYGSPLFALAHVGSVIGPALTWLMAVGLAAGHSATLTLRQMWVAITGSIASIVLAFVVEIIGLLGGGVAVTAIAYSFPGGRAEVTRLLNLMELWMETPPQPEELLTVLASPVVLGLLILLLTVITPLIEELGKTIIVGVMCWIERPSLTRAFVWGAACGIGFAMVEGVANSLNGDPSAASWGLGVASRVMATAMHALVSGILGVGFGLAWRKRWWALPLTYLIAVTFHGLWNLSVILMMGGTAWGVTVSPWGFLGMVGGMGLLGALILLTPVGLLGLPLALRQYEARQAA